MLGSSLVFAVLLALFVFSAIKILNEYERGVVFFLGRFQSVKGPGLIIIIPGLQRMVKVDLRLIDIGRPTMFEAPTTTACRPLAVMP